MVHRSRMPVVEERVTPVTHSSRGPGKAGAYRATTAKPCSPKDGRGVMTDLPCERSEKVRVPRDTEIVTCNVSGETIPVRHWRIFQHDGVDRIFCGPEGERLHNEYWLPNHGSTRTTRA